MTTAELKHRGYISFKEWLFEESRRLNCTVHALQMRIVRGKVPRPTIVRSGGKTSGMWVKV